MKTNIVKNLMLFAALFSIVLLTNLPIITANLMYPEQPLMYLANQDQNLFSGLLSVYLHPKMFHIAILFFRPSGHFLLYQALGPILGWHNTQGLIIVNLAFLALTGCVLVRLYPLLFPGFKLGAYLAFGLYLMHPALILSRLIILHFEFAHVFFVVLSLYCFVRFAHSAYQRHSLLLGSIFFYVVGVTFKEPALMLGPVLAGYLLIFSYHEARPTKAELVKLLMVITTISLCLGLYLSMQWPALHHPLRTGLKLTQIQQGLYKYLLLFLGLDGKFFTPPLWRNAIFTLSSKVTIWLSLAALLFAIVEVYKQKTRLEYKKSLSFILLAALCFLILPVFWAWGLPWHLNLSLVFLSLGMGFGAELAIKIMIKNKALLNLSSLSILCMLAWTALSVNQANLAYQEKEQALALAVTHNAVFSPPALAASLDDKSVLVVEDSRLQDAYLLGASIYPFVSVVLNNPNLDASQNQFASVENNMFIKQEQIYNGTLFRWAYLKPSLKEEVFPFRVERMDEVPDTIIYDWLQHVNNIFCVGYDDKGSWHDRSKLFRLKLLSEKARRHLTVHPYELKTGMAIGGSVSKIVDLMLPEYQTCQLTCDQNKQCKGFTYINLVDQGKNVRQCWFYKKLTKARNQPCQACTGFIKA